MANPTAGIGLAKIIKDQKVKDPTPGNIFTVKIKDINIAGGTVKGIMQGAGTIVNAYANSAVDLSKVNVDDLGLVVGMGPNYYLMGTFSLYTSSRPQQPLRSDLGLTRHAVLDWFDVTINMGATTKVHNLGLQPKLIEVWFTRMTDLYGVIGGEESPVAINAFPSGGAACGCVIYQVTASELILKTHAIVARDKNSNDVNANNMLSAAGASIAGYYKIFLWG